MRRLTAVLILVVCLAALCFGCTRTEIVSVEVVPDTIEDYYDVDSEFDFSAARLSVKYSDGKTIEKKITPEMLSGFDTATTGIRTATVTYESKKASFEYTTVYMAYPAREISTTARLSARQIEYPTGIGRGIFLSAGNLTGIRAIKLTVSGSVRFCDPDFKTVEIVSDFDCVTRYINSKSFKLVIYFPQGISSDLDAASIYFADVRSMDVTLSDIVVSDGTRDYDLP